MKQHITVQQLAELSNTAKERLREWWKPVRGDLCYHQYGGLCVVTNNYIHELVVGYEPKPRVMVDVQIMKIRTKEFLPLLSIGQMIEFLDEKMPISIMGHQSQWHGQKWYWHGGEVPKELTESAIENSLRKSEAPELCDALWQAVKEVLER